MSKFKRKYRDLVHHMLRASYRSIWTVNQDYKNPSTTNITEVSIHVAMAKQQLCDFINVVVISGDTKDSRILRHALVYLKNVYPDEYNKPRRNSKLSAHKALYILGGYMNVSAN